MDAYNLVSLAGLACLVGLAWLASEHRGRIAWRTVGGGIALQLLFGALVFLTPLGPKVFLWINGVVKELLDCAREGAYFLFGRLALAPGKVREGQTSLGVFLAFQALPTIIFFSALMALLYQIGIMGPVVRGFAWVFTRLLRTSGAESLCASSNIFVGIESAFTIRPYLEGMTRSELATILTAGMATIASSVLGFYTSILEKTFPTIAGHLVSASILSAPAALALSKILVPETGTPITLGLDVRVTYRKEPSIVAAIIAGANAGLRLCVGVAALLVAFLGLLALANLGIGELGKLAGRLTGQTWAWSLQGLLGILGHPFALICGVPPADASSVGRLIGERTIVTEVVSYQDLAKLLAGHGLAHPRSAVIAAYALCGFAHVASLAIFVGGIAALAPRRSADLAAVGFKALLAATLACLMTACVAGAFYTGASLLAGG